MVGGQEAGVVSAGAQVVGQIRKSGRVAGVGAGVVGVDGRRESL